MASEQPAYFFQQGKDARCVLYALQNVVANLFNMDPMYFPSCEAFQAISRKIVSSYLWPIQGLIAKKLYDVNPIEVVRKCSCTQEFWNVQIALAWLTEKNIPYKVTKESDMQSDLSDQYFFLLVQLKKHQMSNHAICIVNGWLLDSLSAAPCIFTAENFTREYVFLKGWKILH